MVNELLKISKKPENPLQILQAGLELEIQLVVHTIHAYETHYLRLLGVNVNLLPMISLGYGGRLCNMALISASSTWEGFKGNIIRSVRKNGHSYNEQKLLDCSKHTVSFKYILEPLARRDCIVHNLGIVDQEYKQAIPSSNLNIGDSITTDLSYLKESSAAFFRTATEIVQTLVRDDLLPSGYEKPIHEEFQRDPIITSDSTFTQFKKIVQGKKEAVISKEAEYATLFEVGELQEGIESLPTEEVASSIMNGIGKFVDKVSNAIKTLDGGKWEIISHEITVISKSIIVSFLIKRQKSG